MALGVERKILGRVDGNTNYATQALAVTNGVTINAGDFVYWASGLITNASVAGARLVGMALETVVGTGTNTALICIDPLMRYLLKQDNDSATFASTDVGRNFDLIGATGAQLVDTSSASTTGQLLCTEYNPQIDPVKSDTTYGVFIIAEHVFTTGTGAQ